MNSSGFSMYKGVAGKTVMAVRPWRPGRPNGAPPPVRFLGPQRTLKRGGDFLADLSKMLTKLILRLPRSQLLT
jgi:hypothetical protein